VINVSGLDTSVANAGSLSAQAANGSINLSGSLLGTNADVSVVCERPKIAPHVEAMRRNLATDLGCAIGDVGVKATTSEQLGFTGRGEGIAALAVVLLAKGRASTLVASESPELETLVRRLELDES